MKEIYSAKWIIIDDVYVGTQLFKCRCGYENSIKFYSDEPNIQKCKKCNRRYKAESHFKVYEIMHEETVKNE